MARLSLGPSGWVAELSW